MGYVEAVYTYACSHTGNKTRPFKYSRCTLYVYNGYKEAFYISIVRVIISALLFRGFVGLWYSLAGAFVSYGAMLAVHKLKYASIIGVSVTGGVFHNIGQIVVSLHYFRPKCCFVFNTGSYSKRCCCRFCHRPCFQSTA